MNTNLKRNILSPLALVALTLLAGCATNFEPAQLPANHPANAQAQEAPRRERKRLLASDATTRKTIAQLERKEAPTPDYESGGMSHDMSSMGGMDHSKSNGMEGMDHSNMQGMDMKKPADAPTAKPAEMDHSKMPGMTMPAPAATESPATKEAVETEMKKTSDEMKELSDDMKAKSDAEKSRKKTSKASPTPQSAAVYWTCVMHPEIRADKPGECPKCGMTLVKKGGGTK